MGRHVVVLMTVQIAENPDPLLRQGMFWVRVRWAHFITARHFRVRACLDEHFFNAIASDSAACPYPG